MDFFERCKEINCLKATMGLLHWDMETHMPENGAPFRAEVMGFLAKLVHQRSVDPDLEKSLNEKMMDQNVSPIELKILQKEMFYLKRDKMIPEKLSVDLQMQTSKALSVWSKAKEKNEFARFAPELEKIIALTKEQLNLLKPLYPAHFTLYDCALDYYSPGLNQEKIDAVFNPLKIELVNKIVEKSKKYTAFKSELNPWSVSVELQKKLIDDFLIWFKFDKKSFNVSTSAHPFSMGSHPQDVRVTTVFKEHDPLYAIMSTVHEMGHALYSHQLPEDYLGTSYASDAKMAIHESQSRLFEVCIGLSNEFLSWLHRWLKQNIGEDKFQMKLDELKMRARLVAPSLVRVEADPVTYGMHVLIRYEIEKKLINENLKVSELPQLWSDLYFEYLGVRPSSDKEGVLQDTHWAGGAIGYFPSYLIGTVLACQIHHKLKKEFKDFDQMINEGNMLPIYDYLRKHIHSKGDLETFDEIVTAATGESLTTKYFLDFIDETF